MKDINQITVEHTAFPTFSDLVTAGGNYRPSLRTSVCHERRKLADAYDRAQAERGDSRRACRF